MSLTLFKANKSNAGSLFSIKFAAKSNKQGEDFKPGGFFINIVKQTGWNEKFHTGKFSGGDSVSVKLDQFEAAKILHVIERNWNIDGINDMDRKDLAKRYGFYNMHSSGGNATHINFVPWQRKTDKEQSGFAFYITKTVNGENTTFGAAFSFGEDIALREYIKLGLEHINMAGYQEDKRRFEEGAGKSNGSNGEESSRTSKTNSRGRTSAPKAEPEPEEAPADDEESLF